MAIAMTFTGSKPTATNLGALNRHRSLRRRPVTSRCEVGRPAGWLGRSTTPSTRDSAAPSAWQRAQTPATVVPEVLGWTDRPSPARRPAIVTPTPRRPRGFGAQLVAPGVAQALAPAVPVVEIDRPRRVGLSITRRGRAVLTLSVAGVLLIGLALLSAPVLRSAGSQVLAAQWRGSVAQQTTTVAVLPGQNLWQIAQQRMPGSDPRDAVIQIRELNGLTTSEVRAGQVLKVPVG